ncbi:putative exosome complex exonuclease 2 [Fasciolopsis buskii]|uniref:Ribosomal RNA-processing protein 42 n=1 Tax=Fasciolopsis buskii TaxID=27845 RepID=A0A8E0VJU0_9TREM|nr:putative exosome complex exonuclease 2 [Fasciolopsis buski]
MGDINLLKPLALFEQLFERRSRIEDRKNDEHAPFNVSINVLQSCHGSSLIKLGNTEVICGVKVKVLPDAVDAGCIVCNVELAGLTNRSTHSNIPSREAQILSSSLQRLITTTICPNVSKHLNIYAHNNPQQAVGSYVIKVDVVVLHDDGCLLDACVPAVLTSLLSLSWPKLSGSSGTVTDVSNCKLYEQLTPIEMQKLPVLDWPVTLSFCFIPQMIALKSGTSPLICQPSRRELTLWDTDAGPGYITVSCNSGNILELSMINALMPSLPENVSSTECKLSGSDVSKWQTLIKEATNYASGMKAAILNALDTMVTK